MRTAIRRVAFGLSVALVQVACVMAIHWAWRSTAGEWGLGAWALYFVGFSIAAPALAVCLGALSFEIPSSLPRLFGMWCAVAIVSASYIVFAHGLEDAGWPFWASVLAYGSCVAIAVAIASFGVRQSA